jgi:hypothetical protein
MPENHDSPVLNAILRRRRTFVCDFYPEWELKNSRKYPGK